MDVLSKAKPFEQRLLAILRNDKNVVSLLRTVATKWYPGAYRIVSVMDLNAMEFGRWEEYRSVHDFLGKVRRVVVDARMVSGKRDSKLRDVDEQVLIDTMRQGMYDSATQIVVVLPATLKPITDAYPGLLDGWNGLGEFLWKEGQFRKFPTKSATVGLEV